MTEHEALRFAILGKQANAGAYGIARRGGIDGLAVQFHCARILAISAENETGGLSAARANKAGEPDNFAGVQLEGHVADLVAAREIFHRQPHGAGLAVVRGKFLVETAADHQLDHFIACEVGLVTGCHVVAVAQHGDAVGDGIDFIKAMADINDADALGAEFVHDLEEAVDLARGKGGGGLVHHDDAGVLRERLSDLHDLLLRHGEIAAQGIGINFHANALEQLTSAVGFFLVRNETDPRRFLAEENIFARGQAGHEVELLVNNADAGGL